MPEMMGGGISTPRRFWRLSGNGMWLKHIKTKKNGLSAIPMAGLNRVVSQL
nr:MAG TPA: hypothetical protein [Caudoviricetes sp.]